MKFIETLKLAIAAIWAHKLRSALTLLGMIIGVMAVVVVYSLIQGFNTYVDEKIAGIGAKSFNVQRFNPLEDFKDTDTIAAAQRRNKELTMEDYEYLKERATLIGKIGARARGTPSDGKARRPDSRGRFRVRRDCGNRRHRKPRHRRRTIYCRPGKRCSAASRLPRRRRGDETFPVGSPLGQEISIAGLPYRVIGVETARGTVFGIPQDNFILVPLKTYANNFGGLIRQRSLYFVATSKTDDLFNDAVDEARFLMRTRRKLAANEKDNFGIVTPDAITGLRDRLFGTIFIVAIAVPSIALLVGAIVIMNIMLVSVTERTKEIGIRKSLGARQMDILKQFLVEAVTLSAIGGAIGVTIAWIIGRVLTAVFFPTFLSLGAIFIAVGVSMAVGVMAGVFPAWKAARLDPIEALRAE